MGIQIGKKEPMHSLFVNDIILYLENFKNSTKKLLQPINFNVKWQATKYTKARAFL